MRTDSDIKEFLRKKEENQWNIHGIEIVKDNEIIMNYGDTQSRYPIYSATKTITSIAAGLASDDNKFSIEESLYEYLKGIIPAAADSKKVEQMKHITIKRLLTMSIKGFDFRPSGDDWLEYSIANIPDDITRYEFAYSNIPAYFVSLSLQRALSEHLIDYLKPRLFKPLGIENPISSNCPMGYFYGASGMYMSVSELSRTGQLLLNNGVCKGVRILSEKWIKQASAVQIHNDEGGYGYFLWKYKSGFMISGKWGQKSIIMPDRGLCITYLSDMQHKSGEVLKATKDMLQSL